MKLLVELGADPLLPNQDGSTPLMAAAGLGTCAADEEAGTEDECIAAVEYLLTLGSDVNTVDKKGETAMHGAAYKSLPKMVQLLADAARRLMSGTRRTRAAGHHCSSHRGFALGTSSPPTKPSQHLKKSCLPPESRLLRRLTVPHWQRRKVISHRNPCRPGEGKAVNQLSVGTLRVSGLSGRPYLDSGSFQE